MTPNSEPATTNTEPNTLVLTVPEVAERLKISQWMVNKLIRERTLGSIRIGTRRLIPNTDLDEYLRRARMTDRGVRHGR